MMISVKDFGARGDGLADDTAAIQAALDHAKANAVEIGLPEGRYRITSTLRYHTEGQGRVSGLRLRGSGMEQSEIVNNIGSGGPAISLSSGASVGDFQFGGILSGFKISESGSGPESSGIVYRGVWYQRFEGLQLRNLNGSGLRVRNTQGDFDSSAHVEVRNCIFQGCAGPGFDSSGASGGVSQHAFVKCSFQDCGTAYLLFEGCGHVRIIQCAVAGYAAAVPGVWLKAGADTNRSVTIEGGEYGNSLGVSIQVDAVIGLDVRNLRIVRRSGEVNHTHGIRIGDGGSVNGVRVENLLVQIDTAAPTFTLFTVGTSLPTIGKHLTIKAPILNSFASGNVFIDYAPGTQNRSVEVEDNFGVVHAAAPKRVRATYPSPGAITPSFLSNGVWSQFNLTGSGTYTIHPPFDGAYDGALWIVSLFLGSNARVRFEASIHHGAYIDAIPGPNTATFRYDAISSVWRQVGRWSSSSRHIHGASGTIRSSATDLHTYTFPANTFQFSGSRVRIVGSGSTANNANEKLLSVYVNGTRMTVSLAASQAGSWKAEVDLTMTSPNAVYMIATVQESGPLGNNVFVEQALIGPATGSPIDFRFSGRGGANNDIVQNFTILESAN